MEDKRIKSSVIRVFKLTTRLTLLMIIRFKLKTDVFSLSSYHNPFIPGVPDIDYYVMRYES
jgi:hypothetical protein